MSFTNKLQMLVNQAQFNGFDFQQWFQMQIGQEWRGRDWALEYLSVEKRYFALLFSHEFAKYFWHTGARISFTVPAMTYSRVNSRGEVIVVTRKPFTRRSVKPDAWKYHLRQMAAAEDPVQYLSRFLPAAHAVVPRKGAPQDDIAIPA
ncbi:MAG: hypothetical protein P4L40_13535 [Terracidiphilus sp.]|nr:hypothetical protein [Terracidiphilus sp.]